MLLVRKSLMRIDDLVGGNDDGLVMTTTAPIPLVRCKWQLSEALLAEMHKLPGQHPVVFSWNKLE